MGIRNDSSEKLRAEILPRGWEGGRGEEEKYTPILETFFFLYPYTSHIQTIKFLFIPIGMINILKNL
jgi:hypothetical protein